MKVAVLGSTGVVGREYLRRLENHPWFEVGHVGARSLGTLETIVDLPLVFSCAGEEVSEIEKAYMEQGSVVISHASHWREKAPVIVPEINGMELEGWQGNLIAKPNCTIQSYLLPLHALRAFDPMEVAVTTLQALSGAGKNGPELEGNVLPYIAGEEEKCAEEPKKILGLPNLKISSHCNRVPVIDGHLACVSARFAKPPSREEILEAWKSFPPLDLPSAPTPTLIYREEADRPQPRLDRDAGEGMAISIGRLRDCPLFDCRFTALSHNVMRGAAGGGILTAELLKSLGRFG